jgi:hypothetical protein
LAQYYEKWIESSPPPLRRVVACAATIWIAALCIIVPIGAVIGPDIYNYLVWVLRDIKPQVEYRAGFSDQLLYYSYGIGGRLMMGKAVTICLAMWGVGIGYAALRNRAALPRIIGLMLVILVSYAIPSFTSAKFVWFGAAFDSLLIIATVYLIALLYEPFASQGGHGKIGAMISAAVGVAGIALLLNSNLSPQVSGLLGMDAAARSDMADRTERIWQVLRTHEKVRLGSNPTGHVSNVMTFAVEPIAGTVISFYSAKEGLPMRNVDFSYATSVDELLSKLPDVDYVVAGPSFEHPLSGAKLGDAFREAMDKRSDFSRIATIPLQTAKGMAIIYERNLP